MQKDPGARRRDPLPAGGSVDGALPGLRCQVLSPSAARADELESRCKDQFAERDPQAFLRKLDAWTPRMNNFSLMLLLEYRGVRILLPGDTNRSGYEGLPAQSLRADLFKVGHHGQRDGHLFGAAGADSAGHGGLLRFQ